MIMELLVVHIGRPALIAVEEEDNDVWNMTSDYSLATCVTTSLGKSGAREYSVDLPLLTPARATSRWAKLTI